MQVQIIAVLFVLLILYYAVMIFLDIQKEKAAKAAEQERNHEEDIDISDEARTFKSVMITRDEPKKEQTSSTSSDSGSTSEEQDSPESKNDESKNENGDSDSFKREGYREAYMTDGIPVEQIIQQVDEYAETGKGPLGEIIFECRSAQF